MKNIHGISKGWFPVYWELFNDYNLTSDEIFFFHYLVETFPMWNDYQEIDGVLYKRIAYSMIQEKFRGRAKGKLAAISEPTIRSWFSHLQEQGYIKIWQPYDKGPIYYTITLEVEVPVEGGYFGQ